MSVSGTRLIYDLFRSFAIYATPDGRSLGIDVPKALYTSYFIAALFVPSFN